MKLISMEFKMTIMILLGLLMGICHADVSPKHKVHKQTAIRIDIWTAYRAA